MTTPAAAADGWLTRRWLAIRSSPLAAWLVLALAMAAYIWLATRPGSRPASLLWLVIPAGVVAGSRIAWTVNLVLIVLVLIALVFFTVRPWDTTVVDCCSSRRPISV